MFLAADQHRRKTGGDQPPVRGLVTLAGGGEAANCNSCRTFHDDVRRAGADAYVGEAGRGNATDQNGGATGADRAADMRLRSIEHRTHMKVRDARSRKGHVSQPRAESPAG